MAVVGQPQTGAGVRHFSSARMCERGAAPASTIHSGLVNLVESDWLMMVTQLSSFTRGAVHGHVHIFAENGTLLAASSQTGLLPKPL